MNVIHRVYIALKYFRKYKKYLANGQYYIGESLRTFHRCGDSYTISVKGNQNKSSTKVFLIKCLNLTGIFSVHNGTGVFSGSEMYLANNVSPQKNVRIFSPSENIVLSFIHNREEYSRILDIYLHVCNKFPVPVQYDHDDIQMSYSERMIFSKNRSDWTDDDLDQVYKVILEQYSKYYLSQTVILGANNQERAFLIEVSPEMKTLKDFVADNIMEGEEFPCYFQHGDLSSYNILLSMDGDCYWIDWEHAGIHPFYFDIFFCVLNELIQSGNRFLYDGVLSGRYDDLLQSIYEVTGVTNNDHIFWINRTLINILMRIYDNNAGNMTFVASYFEKYQTSGKL